MYFICEIPKFPFPLGCLSPLPVELAVVVVTVTVLLLISSLGG